MITLCESGVVIAKYKWVKTPHIKKCMLPIMSPEILSHNVQAGSTTTTHISQKFSCDISDLTMPD